MFNNNTLEEEKKKKRFFFILTILIPCVLFISTELILRLINYGGDLRLFIDGPPGYEQYYRCNLNVARRYFTVQSSIPTPPHQIFLRKKPKNGYRIFVLGESSAAGFPYSANGSFPNILWRALSETFPDKYIEVINLSLSAINSYTLLDFVDEIVKQSPDLILIYTGHNEYYGALGVGSSQSLGPIRGLIKLYLTLNSLRTFLLLRDVIGWFRLKISSIVYGGSVIKPSATLMETMVAEQIIPYKGPLYEIGKKQFFENMSAILEKLSRNRVPVIISELVSNMRDQPPFISVEDSVYGSAEKAYKMAQELERKKDFENARRYYLLAKDLDALRFRAPEEFNEIIRNLAAKYNQICIHMLSEFEKYSSNGIIGRNLIHEHLHPTKEGFCLMAKKFYEAMREAKFIEENWREISFEDICKSCTTELDSVYAELVIKSLKGGWPFQPKGLPNLFMNDFQPGNYLESLAFRVLPSDSFNIEVAHLELAKIYEKKGDWNKAISEYNALIASIPQEIEFYNKIASIYVRQQKYDSARVLLKKSLIYARNPFAYKWIGQIALMNNDAKTAIENLNHADLWDPQVVFNLGRAYLLNAQPEEAEKCYKRLKVIAPRSEYTPYLQRMILLAKVQKYKR